MVGVGLGYLQQLLAGCGIGPVRGGTDGEAGDDRVADPGPVGVIQIEGAAAGKVGGKGDPQKPLLAAA